MRKLYQCLSGVASLYANKIRVKDYKELRKQLKHRFSTTEESTTARRLLRNIRQREDESLVDFSQRVYFLADDAFKDESRKTLEKNAAEYFLLGCKDKQAALKAMEQRPTTVPKALKFVKQAQAATSAIYGAKAEYKHRQVSFHDDDPVVRRCTGSENDLKQLKGKLSKKVEPSNLGGTASAKSAGTPPPTPPRSNSPENVQCYGCKGFGHYRRDCPNKSGSDRSSSPTARANVKPLKA